MADVAKKACEPLVGADIECFLFDKEYNLVPCVGLIPGTKEHPHPMDGMKNGFAMQEDNVMAEYNIPPAATYSIFTTNVVKAQSALKAYLASRYPKQGYMIVHQADALFTEEQLSSKQARTIGCEPDFDAYQGGAMRRDLPALSKWRGAGGHIHLGGDFQCPDFVAALFADLCIGVRNGLCGADHRAQWYGQPGVFRPKPYGIEYRTPSAAWASHKQTIQQIGNSALRLAKWLSYRDAKEIQTTFRAIDWGMVRQAMVFDKELTGDQRARRRNAVINMGQKAGAPV